MNALTEGEQTVLQYLSRGRFPASATRASPMVGKLVRMGYIAPIGSELEITLQGAQALAVAEALERALPQIARRDPNLV